MAGRSSRHGYVEVDAASTRASELVALRVKALDGGVILVRPGTTDLQVLRDTFLSRYHMPPPELSGELRLIWDLGANIGTTIAHFCHLYPEATVVGVELDPDNASLCRLNTAAWRSRCEVIDAAVWPYDGTVKYVVEAHREWGSRVSADGDHLARALSLNSLARDAATIDFVKMDIEGAESRVLREATYWASRVRGLKVELHGGYSVAECLLDLERLGFASRRDPSHPACVIGVRRRGGSDG